jgi:proteasome lid subunit RPN8/RPN11
MSNSKAENRERRYLITAKDYQWAEERARNEGLEILGLYHSHPDHPAEPSAFDLDHALPAWSYVIVSVQKARVVDTRSWVLLDDRSRFKEERIDVVDEAIV